MDGEDLKRAIGRLSAGRATRASLAALSRQQEIQPGAADEALRVRRVATPGPEDRAPASRLVERSHG